VRRSSLFEKDAKRQRFLRLGLRQGCRQIDSAMIMRQIPDADI